MFLYPRDFINTRFLDEYRNIIYKHKYYYIGFALVCVGVEFLGKCLDENEQDWQRPRLSKKHFEGAIKQTMPKYEPHKELLYEELRSGFAHGLLPGRKVGLTHRDESLRYGTKHLSKHEGAVTVIIENFYDDFEAACREVLQRPFPKNDKMSKPLLAIPLDLSSCQQRPNEAGGRSLNARTTQY